MKWKIILLVGLSVCLFLLVGYKLVSNIVNQNDEMQEKHVDRVREINGLNITLNGIRIDENSIVKDGNHIIIVDLSFENVGDQMYSVSPYKLTLMDKDGYAYSSISYDNTKGIIGGQLHPGRINRGEVAFSVPIDVNYELIYTDHLRTGQVTWEVTVQKE